MNRFDFVIIIFSILLLAAGLMFSFWPLVPLGVALLVLYGHTAFGITAALFFDVIYGVPVGLHAALHFPFLLFSLVCVGLRQAALAFVLERDTSDRI